MSKKTKSKSNTYAFGNIEDSVSGPLFHGRAKSSSNNTLEESTVAPASHLRLLPPDEPRRPDATRQELLDFQVESS